VEIVDFKTGSAVDDEGNPKVEYGRQLRAYAALLRESEPSVPLRGYLDDGRRHLIELGAAEMGQWKGWWRSLLSLLPLPGTAIVGELARPGPDCSNCSYRPACNAYRTTAPEWWASPPEFRIPIDAGGVVTALERRSPGVDLDLTDFAGRSVRIEAVGLRHGTEHLDVGDAIWAFGLRAVRFQRGNSGRWLHPRVFRDLSLDVGTQPAWGAAVFLAAGTS